MPLPGPPLLTRIDMDVFLRAVRAEALAMLDGDDEASAALHGLDRLAYGDVRRLVEAGGKMFRPQLAYLGFLAGGGDPEAVDVVRLGAGLELCHCAALIHDDIIDSADLRRGEPTSHLLWAGRHDQLGRRGSAEEFGVRAALLSGLLANELADHFIYSLPLPVRSFWRAMKAEMIVGEFVELEATADEYFAPGLLREIARMKTTSYTVTGPLVLGARLAGAMHLESALSRYGELVGEAFQLRDDLLDMTATAACTGKTVGGDLAQAKTTVLSGVVARLDAAAAAACGPERQRRVESFVRDAEGRARIDAWVEGLLDRAVDALGDGGIAEPVRAALASAARMVARWGEVPAQ